MTGGAAAEVRLLHPADLAVHRSALLAAHDEIHEATGDEAAAYALVLDEHRSWPGFRWAAAIRPGNGRLVGFAYGYTGTPGQPWHDIMAAALGEREAAEWLPGQFEFAQFGVVAEERGRGIAGRLYDALFDGLPHRRAVLTVRVGNEPAAAFYRRRGWETLHNELVTPRGEGPYEILGLRIDGG